MDTHEAELPSQRGETWNDTETIARHRGMTSSQRVALAIEVSRAALSIAASAQQKNGTRLYAPEEIAAALNTGGVAYVIVGGLALAAHGVVRATPDLDLVPEPSPANLGRLATVLGHLGASVDAVPAEKATLAARTLYGDVHVLSRVATVPPCSALTLNAISVGIAGTPAPFSALTDLRAMKIAYGRPRDLVDVAELDELNGL